MTTPSLSRGVAKLLLLGAPQLQLAQETKRLEPRTAGLLAFLALEGETPKYKLAGLLWPDSGETAARNNMRQLLRRLRALAGDIITGDDRIGLQSDLEVDVKGFSYLDTPSPEQFEETGKLLEGFDYDDAPDFADWLDTVRQELHDLRCRAAQQEAQRLEQVGNYKQALEFGLRWKKLEILSEEAAQQVSKLYYLMGDRRSAISTLERFRQRLQDEVGAELSPESERFIETLEKGSNLLTAPAKPKEKLLPTTILRPPVLAGREREWQQMEEAWEEGKLIFLSGEAGSGKSRLATDFLTSKGKFVYESARPGDVHIPYSTHIRLIRGHLQRYHSYEPPLWVRQALSPWFPEFGANVVSSPNPQTQFAEASLEIMRQIGVHGEAMVVDDFQFMDDGTVQVGTYIFSQLMPLRTPGNMQGFVGCFRGAELSPFFKEQVANMVASGMAIKIEIEPLPAESIVTLVKGLGLENAETLVPGLARYTGGNPLFILETLKYLIETDSLKQGLPSRLAPQGKVATLIGRRLQRLSPSALNVARVAAVAVTNFTLELAAFVLERSGLELAEAHAELEQSQILRANAFSHDLVFEAVLANIPVAVKQLLHARTANYLEKLKNVNPAVLAQHYIEAGDELKAAEYWVQASVRSELSSLLKEGREFAERAVSTYQKHGDPREYEATAQLFEILGMHGSFEELERASSRLAQLSRNSEQKIVALTKWAETFHMTRRYKEALAKVDEALHLL